MSYKKMQKMELALYLCFEYWCDTNFDLLFFTDYQCFCVVGSVSPISKEFH